MIIGVLIGRELFVVEHRGLLKISYHEDRLGNSAVWSELRCIK